MHKVRLHFVPLLFTCFRRRLSRSRRCRLRRVDEEQGPRAVFHRLRTGRRPVFPDLFSVRGTLEPSTTGS
jgi:hypothetical protein